MTSPFDGRDSFEDETFQDLDLGQADLRERELQGCLFRNVKLGETRWARTRLDDCIFEHCDLTRADVKELVLRGVKFESCKLMGIDFTPLAKFPDIGFTDCDLRYASFVGLALRKTTFTRCAIVEASFIDTDLVESTFDDCQLGGTTFEGCDLRKARFRGAQELFVDPARNQVKGAEIPLEAAVALAASFGMRVSGFGKKR